MKLSANSIGGDGHWARDFCKPGDSASVEVIISNGQFSGSATSRKGHFVPFSGELSDKGKLSFSAEPNKNSFRLELNEIDGRFESKYTGGGLSAGCKGAFTMTRLDDSYTVVVPPEPVAPSQVQEVRVLLGGSWSSNPGNLRAAEDRGGDGHDSRH